MMDETWLAERRLLGSCRCGFAPCVVRRPFCDDGYPEALRPRPPLDVGATVKALAALAAPTPGVDGAPLTGKAQRPPNRHERRRARSRRWTG